MLRAIPSAARRLVAAIGFALALPAVAQCVDDKSALVTVSADIRAEAVATARSHLQSLVASALQRSQAVGAAQMLAEAARSDWAEARTSYDPQVQLSGSTSIGASRIDNFATQNTNQLSAGLQIGAPIYDAGRGARLADWKQHLSEAARYGQLSTQEQIALQTVSLALERSRYARQTDVYRQQQARMTCLVDKLQIIVASDPGRASELVQARKTRQQVQLAYDLTVVQLRQSDIRLQRFVGDELPPVDGLAGLFNVTPDLTTLQDGVERSFDVLQMGEQAFAATEYARAVDASGKPQLHWAITGSKGVANGHPASLGAGLALTVPLVQPGQRDAVAAARARADAARLQRADVVEARRSRVAELHMQSLATIDRARQIGDVLKDSALVLDFTLRQWHQLGRRSLFDVMAAESDHFGLQIQQVNAYADAQQSHVLLWSLGLGIEQALR